MNRILDEDPGLDKEEYRELKRKVEQYLGDRDEHLNL